MAGPNTPIKDETTVSGLCHLEPHLLALRDIDDDGEDDDYDFNLDSVNKPKRTVLFSPLEPRVCIINSSERRRDCYYRSGRCDNGGGRRDDQPSKLRLRQQPAIMQQPKTAVAENNNDNKQQKDDDEEEEAEKYEFIQAAFRSASLACESSRRMKTNDNNDDDDYDSGELLSLPVLSSESTNVVVERHLHTNHNNRSSSSSNNNKNKNKNANNEASVSTIINSRKKRQKQKQRSSSSIHSASSAQTIVTKNSSGVPSSSSFSAIHPAVEQTRRRRRHEQHARLFLPKRIQHGFLHGTIKRIQTSKGWRAWRDGKSGFHYSFHFNGREIMTSQKEGKHYVIEGRRPADYDSPDDTTTSSSKCSSSSSSSSNGGSSKAPDALLLEELGVVTQRDRSIYTLSTTRRGKIGTFLFHVRGSGSGSSVGGVQVILDHQFNTQSPSPSITTEYVLAPMVPARDHPVFQQSTNNLNLVSVSDGRQLAMVAKTSADHFHVCFKYPIGAFQIFALALARFDCDGYARCAVW